LNQNLKVEGEKSQEELREDTLSSILSEEDEDEADNDNTKTKDETM
jgi:hypothetical protein